MADPTQTVESVRAFLRNERVAVSPEVVRVAADYAALCREANHRLRRCEDFLHQGLMGEAVDFASVAPPLIDFALALNFKEAGNWDAQCAALGLARRSPLLTETVTKLLEAIKSHEPVRALLAKHRFLSLSRAPLAERMQVVRQLLAEQPDSPIWKKQLAEYEQARLGGLRGEAAAAIASGDLASVDQLLAEVKSKLWESMPPADLVQSLERASAAMHTTAGVLELRALLPKVREAFGAMAYDECTRVFAQWAKVVKERKLLVPPELLKEIMPLARWIDEQEERQAREKQFRAACNAVVQAVQTREPVEEVKLLYRQAVGFEMDIPAEVESTYRRAIEEALSQALTEKKRQYGLAAALVGAIVAALAALVFVILNAAKR